MTDDEIETQRVAGEMIFVLQNGTPEEKESLLRTIAAMGGDPEKWKAEYCPENVPAGLFRCPRCQWFHDPGACPPPEMENCGDGEEWKQ